MINLPTHVRPETNLIDWETELANRFPSICSDIECGAWVPPELETVVEKCLAKICANGIPCQIVQVKTKFQRLCIYFQAPFATGKERAEIIHCIAEAVEEAEELRLST